MRSGTTAKPTASATVMKNTSPYCLKELFTVGGSYYNTRQLLLFFLYHRQLFIFHKGKMR